MKVISTQFAVIAGIDRMCFPHSSWNFMDTSKIESMIADSCGELQSDPELHELLIVVADRQGVAARPEDIDRGSRFVFGYIRQVPYMMKVAWTAAINVGLEAEMKQILEMVESYWIEGDDIIPDELGVIGLLDDAYCSLTSLQAVSDHYQLQTGKYLFPDNLGSANKAMRKIIDEPYATELDRMVFNTMHKTGLVDAVKSLASEEKRIHFSNKSTIWNHGPAGSMEVSELAGLGLLDDL
jgi:uncharacterized membrane protein YkvA (DUF1232 family)